MKFKVDFLPIPTAKIESIEYSFDTNNSEDHIPTLKHSEIRSGNNNWIKIITSGVSNGTKVNSIKVNNNDLFSGIQEINNNFIKITLDKTILENIPQSRGSGKPSFNIVSIKIGNLFSWNDCLKKIP